MCVIWSVLLIEEALDWMFIEIRCLVLNLLWCRLTFVIFVTGKFLIMTPKVTIAPLFVLSLLTTVIRMNLLYPGAS